MRTAHQEHWEILSCQDGLGMVVAFNTVGAVSINSYIDKPFWNADKQRADHKREYIEKFDGETFTPNKNFYRLQAEYQQSVETAKTGRVPLN